MVVLIQEIMIDTTDKTQRIRLMTTARRGERARARVARPSPFTNFTSGPLLAHPLSWLRFSLTFKMILNP
jgi:hypothetical protein